ncbi:MAG: DMT family transporter [Methanococcaceae archaeon]
MIPRRKYVAESALLLSTIIWGGTFVIVKESLHDISSMLFVSIRFFIAAAVILPFAWKKLKAADRQSLMRGALLGVLLFLGFSTQTMGLQRTTATKSGFITGALVLFTPLLQFIIEKRKPSKASLSGSAIVAVGLLFLSVKNTTIQNLFFELGSNFNSGDMLTLICAAIFSMHIVYLDKISKITDFVVLTFTQIFVTAVLSLIGSFTFSAVNIEPAFIHFTHYLLFGILYSSLLATVVTMSFQTRYQKEISPTKAGIIYSFEPVFSAFLAYLVLSETLPAFGVIGSILIFSGLIIAELF